MSHTTPPLTAKDFASNQEVKWCPGCGDYSILKQVQTVFPAFGVAKENIVFVSGIGCAARFTYYMDTYGMHTIHGRAATIAAGIKTINPNLSVWMVSGDGDALSIGGNHFIHLFRKNFDIKYLMFNNQIYGLTKGQYSPTSEQGKVAKSTPYGSVELPFNPPEVALGAKATFVARSLDRDPKHLQAMLTRANAHKGTAFVEIYQNCPVFNDGTFFAYSEKETKQEAALILEHGAPLLFGNDRSKGIRLDGTMPQIVDLNEGTYSQTDLWIHDESDKTKANLLARFPDFDLPLPRPFGVFYAELRPTYEDLLNEQANELIAKKGKPMLNKILAGEKTWTVL
ncbi:MAG: 2-oxoacid:ferredoxin oxidoreductase subunit beta [Chitinophagia bacterium]|nr:2-oxoacid:ferredoxin oxidoreductase subunit beta [Chitinophagia bacterium]